MTKPQPCLPAPEPLEAYAASFDGLFAHVAQRHGFREYLTGLLAPRDRNKTLTCLAGAEPVVGSKDAAVQRLQFFLSKSSWNAEEINDRRLVLLRRSNHCPAQGGHAGHRRLQGPQVIRCRVTRRAGTGSAEDSAYERSGLRPA
ncbi:hypothetical protein [Streptomyces sp. NPDC051561]|uniref:hypothetical protein n=1 Tax=Streptomyces sp. NPDC051561 TaxID=3365658 RepID=UPI0037A00BEB